jgi:hypothetical protein
MWALHGTAKRGIGERVHIEMFLCRSILLCRERQRRDLESAKKDPEFPYYFDTEAADHVVWFFSQLTHLMESGQENPLHYQIGKNGT